LSGALVGRAIVLFERADVASGDPVSIPVERTGETTLIDRGTRGIVAGI